MGSSPPPPPPLPPRPPPTPSPSPPQIAHLLSQFPITPKPDPDGPIPAQTPIPAAARSALMLALTPELCGVLHRELAPSPHDDPFLVRCLRQSQLHLEALAARARLRSPSSSSSSAAAAAPPAYVPLPPPPPPRGPPQKDLQLPQEPRAGDGSNPSGAKKRARSSADVVRATNLGPADHLRYRALVRRARLTFEALRGAYQRQEPTGARNRHDLRASSRMLSAGHWLHRDVRFVGDIPGVLVGDAFYYRAELCVVGLHTAPQAGIGYIPGSLLDEGQPVATSIVSSGGYLDDEDTGDVLVYSGSGGRARNRLNHHADQTLERGNLALHNSYQYGVEVRVIRGHSIDQGFNRKVYVYDGLYRVVSSTFGPGKSGHDVCKFKLMRLPGQDDLASKSWHTAKQLKECMDARVRPPRYISLDLSKGTEVLRVPVCNKLDGDRSPLMFQYTVHPDFPVPPAHGLVTVKQQRGCNCVTGCGSKCRCERKNGGGPVYNEDDTLVMGRPVVYECGALCGCPMTCVNRATQRGMKHRLEVFRSNETGWGVRALDLIPPGAFVCEYSGDIVVVDDQSGSTLMEVRSIIDPRRFPERWKEWGDASAVDPSNKRRQFAKFSGPGYLLDVSQKRNVACYISHSCTPNVFLQFVVRGNEHESFPHMMVFAMETIPPMRELSIDYGIDGDLSAS